MGTTIVWTLAGAVFDARQAKRIFPYCSAAAIAGYSLGGLAAGPLAGLVGTGSLLVAQAALLVIAAAILVLLPRWVAVRSPARQRDRTVAADLQVGLVAVRQSPVLRLVAVAYVLFGVLLFTVSYPFLGAAAGAFPDEAQLALALGLLSAGTTVAALLVSLLLAGRLFARLGVTGVALLLPLVYVVGFGVWIVSFSFVTAAGVRVAQQVTQRGLSNAAWSALFNTVPLDRRAQAMAFCDGLPGQAGTILSGILLLTVGGTLSSGVLFWIGALAGAAAVAVVLAIRGRYGASLLTALRAGRGEQLLSGGRGVEALSRDPAVMVMLRAELGSAQPGARRLAVEVLAHVPGPGATDLLVGCAADPAAEVRRASLDGLAARRAAGPSVRQAAAAHLGDPDPQVRQAAVRAMPVEGLDELAVAVDDPDARVRGAVARAWGPADTRAAGLVRALVDSPSAQQRAEGLEAAADLRLPIDPAAHLTDPSPAVRAAALACAGVSVDAAVAALDDPSAAVRPAALAALGAGPRQPRRSVRPVKSRRAVTGRDRVVAWTRAQLERAALLRGARSALGAAPGPRAPRADEWAFLLAILDQREQAARGRALEGLAALGMAEATGPVRRALLSPDGEATAQAVEALDTLGDRRLRSALAAAMDTAPADRQDVTEVLLALAGLDDRWVGIIAERVLSRALPGSDDVRRWTLVQSSSRTTSELDMMLLLRRVPLFAALSPEDLHRVAQAAAERSYDPGEVLMAEGDSGDELVVLIEGGVRVERASEAGPRLIRTYGPGEHIGELAVLRQRPRAATVVADEGGARGLVVDGAAIAALVRERPDAAMAMLATLAERISVQ